LVDSLPDDKAQALIEYARYLAEKADEEAWEQQLDDPKYEGKLSATLAEVEAEIRNAVARHRDGYSRKPVRNDEF
jgi:hypothetical protein